jgi:hypothetical protein
VGQENGRKMRAGKDKSKVYDHLPVARGHQNYLNHDRRLRGRKKPASSKQKLKEGDVDKELVKQNCELVTQIIT